MAARLLVRLLAHLRDDLLAQLRGWRDGTRARLARRWAARPQKRQLAAQGLVVGLVALGLVALDARHRLAERLPSAVDWRALTALLERDARPGDLVVISPPWLERARLAVPARLPVLATGALDAEWLPGVRRAWLVAAAGVTSPPPRPPLGERAPGSDTQQVGRLRVSRLDLAAPVLPLGSLAEQSGVATRWRDVHGVARRCLELAARPGEPARLPSPLPLIPLGGALAGHVAALPPLPAGPVRLLVRIDGGPPIPVEVPSRGDWQPFRIDTADLAGSAHQVSVTAEAPVGVDLCVEALVLP